MLSLPTGKVAQYDSELNMSVSYVFNNNSDSEDAEKYWTQYTTCTGEATQIGQCLRRHYSRQATRLLTVEIMKYTRNIRHT